MARATGRSASRDSSGRSGAGTPTLLIILLQVPSNLGCGAHRLEQTLVEALRSIDTAVLQQMIHRDHFGDNGDVLSRVEGHGDLREGDVEDRRSLAVETRSVDHQFRVPVYQLDDDLDALLLTNGANAEHGWHVDEADAANLHVMPLQLVPASEQHLGAAARRDDVVVRNQPVPALHEIEHALRLADPAAADEEQPDAEDVRQRAVKRRGGSELLLQPGLNARIELVGLESRSNDRYASGGRELGHLLGRLLTLRDEDRGNWKGEIRLEDFHSRGFLQRREITDLDRKSVV